MSAAASPSDLHRTIERHGIARDLIDVIVEPRYHGYEATEDLRVTGTTVRIHTRPPSPDRSAARGGTPVDHRLLAPARPGHRQVPVESDAYEPLAWIIREAGAVAFSEAMTELTSPRPEPPLQLRVSVDDNGTTISMVGAVLLELKRPERSLGDLRAQLQRHATTGERLMAQTGEPATVVLLAGFEPDDSILDGLPPWVHAVDATTFVEAILRHTPPDRADLKTAAAFVSRVLHRRPRSGCGVWSAEWLPPDLARIELRTILPVDVGSDPQYLMTYNDILTLPVWSGARAARHILSVLQPVTGAVRETLYPVEDVLAHARHRGALRGEIPRSDGEPWRLRGIHTTEGVVWLWHQSRLRELLRVLGLQLPGLLLPADIPVAWPRNPSGTTRFYESEPILRWCDERGRLRDALSWMVRGSTSEAAA